MGLSNKLSCEAGNFSHCCNPPRFLPPEVLRLYILMMDPWIGWSDLLSICFSWFIHMQIWDLLVHQPLPYQPVPSPATLPESSPPWLPISALPTGLVNVSSLTPRLSDFHTVRFSGSSGYFLSLNVLLSFF